MTEKARQKTRELQERGQELKRKAQDWTQQATDIARDVSANADLYLRENRWTTVMMVGVFGMVIGFLLGRSRD